MWGSVTSSMSRGSIVQKTRFPRALYSPKSLELKSALPVESALIRPAMAFINNPNQRKKGAKRMVLSLWRRRRWRACAFAGFAIALGGCSTMSLSSSGTASQKNADAASGPPPIVQNCAIVGINSPSKFACDGKVYTSFQLMKLRQDWDKSRGS
jgi:hypothetical protein